MRFIILIISKFKDYYDQISNIYGMDRKIVFDRTKKLPQVVKLHVNNKDVIKFLSVMTSHHRYSFFDDSYEKFLDYIKYMKIDSFTILSVCGKPFYVGHRSDGMVVVSEDDEHIISSVTGWRQEKLNLDRKEYLERLHKEVGSPVIMLVPYVLGFNEDTRNLSDGDYYFYLDENIPNLSQIEGFARRYPKEQIYQDISYWIANILNPSPDIQPVGKPPQTDVEKLISHGFDKKISFRHRKNA